MGLMDLVQMLSHKSEEPDESGDREGGNGINYSDLDFWFFLVIIEKRCAVSVFDLS